MDSLDTGARASHDSELDRYEDRFRRPRRQAPVRRGWPRWLFVVPVAFLVAAIAGFNVAHSERIYPGVSVGSVQVGGLILTEATDRIGEAAAKAAGQNVTLRLNEQTWNATLAELGITWNVPATAQKALAVGHEGAPWSRLSEQAGAVTVGRNVGPVLVVDEQRFDDHVRKLAGVTEQPMVEPTLAVSPSGVTVTPGRPGVRIASDAVLTKLSNDRQILGSGTIDLTVERVAPRITEAEVERARAEAEAFVGKPITLRYQSKNWTLQPNELKQVTTARHEGDQLKIGVDPSRLGSVLTPVAAAVEKPPKDASLKVTERGLVASNDESGLALDLAKLAEGLTTAGKSPNREVTVSTQPVAAGIKAADLTEARATYERMISKPVELTLADKRWKLSGEKLNHLVAFAWVGGKYQPVLDKEAAVRYAEEIADDVNVPPIDPRFSFKAGKIEVLSEGRPGKALAIEPFLALLRQMLESDNRLAELPMETSEPRYSAESLSQLAFKDILGEGYTSYGGGSPARNHNVELATSRLNGVVIPPGAVFSFNRSLGSASLAAGFKTGYGITLDANRPKTIPSVAGGICQVSTTLFHAAFWSGFPILERTEHLYWIPRYASRGIAGMDTTVDEDSGVDFRFHNTTGNFIAIESSVDRSRGVIGFRIWGTEPGWKVATDPIAVKNRVPAPAGVFEDYDPDAAPGTRIQVESAQDGFESSLRRVVTKNGQVVDDWTMRSYYRPSRNVILIGGKKPAPSPTGSPSPSVTGSPAAGTPGPATTPPAAAGTPTPLQGSPIASTPAAAAPTATPPAAATQPPAVPTAPPAIPTVPLPIPTQQPQTVPTLPPAAPTLPPTAPTSPPAQPTPPPAQPTPRPAAPTPVPVASTPQRTSP